MTTEKMIRDLEATKNSFEGKFVGTGEVNVAWMIEDIVRFIKALEADAEPGRAIKTAFRQGFSVNKLHSILSNIVYCLYDVESLLNWAKGVNNETNERNSKG